MTVSVFSGKCGPCCSIAPTGSSSTSPSVSATSGQASASSRIGSTAGGDGRRVNQSGLVQPGIFIDFPGADRLVVLLPFRALAGDEFLLQRAPEHLLGERVFLECIHRLGQRLRQR